MPRLILHAGFPKCGSTAVFFALRRHLDLLADHGVRIFDRSLNPSDDPDTLNPPLWEMQKAIASPAATEAMRGGVRRAVKTAAPDALLILSTENLSNPRMARVFKDIGAICEVELVFYFRPQIDWIPSAWKQWNLKQGYTIEETVSDYIKATRPNYLASARTWLAEIPDLKVRPRPFVPDLMKNGDPCEDFFDLLGLPFDPARRSSDGSNPSIDYALMHLMMLHHDRLFSGRDDNTRVRALLSLLPARYQRTNAQMLTQAQSDRIADHFHADNVTLCRDLMGLTADEAEMLVRRYFHRRVEGTAYGDIPESEILDRANRILQEIAGRATHSNGAELLLELTNPVGACEP